MIFLSSLLAIALAASIYFVVFERKTAAPLKGLAYVDYLMTLPEDKIDIGIVALTLAKEFYPDLDVPAYSKKIDDVVAIIGEQGRRAVNPVDRIMVFNMGFFVTGGYRFDWDSLAKEKKEPYFLNYVLDNRKGFCATLPMLYMAAAQRLGYPVYPVFVPGHMFLRYVEPNGAYYNIEVTDFGKSTTDDEYAKDSYISQKSVQMGSYLRTLSYHEYIGELLRMNAVIYSDQGNYEMAIPYLERALALNPRSPTCYANLAYCHQMMSLLCKGREGVFHLHKSFEYDKLAAEHHFVDLRATPAWEEMWRKVKT